MSAEVAEYAHVERLQEVRQEERRRDPLKSAVRVALCRYFDSLDGSEPDDLYRLVVAEVERPLLECVMAYCGGNQSKAAKCLGLNRGTLRKKLREYGMA